MKRLVAVSLLIASGLGCGRPRPPGQGITVSRETTYLVAPLGADGVPDYFSALDERYGKGVTLANNSAVPLVQAFGPRWLSPAVLERMGIGSLPPAGACFEGALDGVHADRLVQAGRAADREKTRLALMAELARASRAPWDPAELSLAVGWLEANEKPLALIVEGGKRPRFWIPFPEGADVTTPIPSLLPYRDAASALVSRAMLRQRSDARGAAADVLATLRLADRVAQGPTLVHSLVGTSLRGIGSGALHAFTGPAITAEDAGTLLAGLRTLREFPSLAERVDQSERFTTLASVLRMRRDGLARGPAAWKELLEPEGLNPRDVPPGLYQVPAAAIDWDEVLRIVNRWFDACAKTLAAPTVEGEQAALAEMRIDFAWTREARKALDPPAVEALVRSAPQDPPTRARLTRAFAAVVLPESLLRARVSRREAAAQFAVGETAVALAAHRRQKGSVPRDLWAARLPGGVRPQPRGDGYEFRYHAWPDQADAAAPLTFAYVAVPERPGVTGIRSFCIDGMGGALVTPGGAEPRVETGQCREPRSGPVQQP